MAYNIFERWPFTSFQNLNLNWVLETMQEAVSTVTEAAATVAGYAARLAGVEATNDTQNQQIASIENVNNQQNQRISNAEQINNQQTNAIRLLESGSLSAVSAELGDAPIADGEGAWGWLSLGCVTPEMFGAAGDGVTDDTNYLRTALKYSINNGKKLVLGKKYYVTASLLTSSDYNDTVTINIEGCAPLKNYIYQIDGYGGIVFANGINLFEGLTIQGSICRLSLMPVSRTQTGSIFKNCDLSAFRFDSCSVSNILAFCHNTSVSSVSQITNSRFLSVYYFGKVDGESTNFVDSYITGNYINGGTELNDNNCFEWLSWNGSTVSGNFIDYYRTIYHPVSIGELPFAGPDSVGNQYQVFRYLYDEGTNAASGVFTSNSDCFNWNDPTTLPKIAAFTPLTYPNRQGEEVELPPYIGRSLATWSVTIENAIIQRNMAKLIFIQHSPNSYPYAKFKFSCNGEGDRFDYNTRVSQAAVFFVNGSYKLNAIDIPFIKTMPSLPSDSAIWNDYYMGQKIMVNNKIYKRVCNYDSSTSTWIFDWADITNSI